MVASWLNPMRRGLHPTGTRARWRRWGTGHHLSRAGNSAGQGRGDHREHRRGRGALAEPCAGAGRADDLREEVIRRRMDVYAEQTEPLVRVYSERGLLLKVDGMGSMDEVTARLLTALGA